MANLIEEYNRENHKTKAKSKAAKPKSKTVWAKGPVETTDPKGTGPMLVGLVEDPAGKYGTMVRYEGAMQGGGHQLGCSKVERFTAAWKALTEG